MIDGDSQQPESPQIGIFRLPGSQPEAQVFNDVYENLSANVALLTVSLQLPPTRQDFVEKVIGEVSCTNRDPHVIFNQIGIRLGFVPENIVKGAFVNLWIRDRLGDFQTLVKRMQAEVDAYNGEQAARGDGEDRAPQP